MKDENVLRNWHEAYREIALRLHDFQKIAVQNEKEGTVSEQLFKRLNTEEFRKKNKWFVRGIEKWANATLDPIQVFAAFSHSKSSDSSRYQNLRIILDLLGSAVKVDEYTYFFEGCPTVMMSRPVTTRGAEFQVEIWAMFDSVMSAKVNGLQADKFMQYKGWYGIELVSFTIFLFWIDSDSFVPLDANTRTFMMGIGKWQEIPYDYNSYKAFCSSIDKPGIIRDIVKIAYQFREGKKENINYLPETSKFLGLESEDKREEKIKRFSHPFRLIAIKPTQLDGHSKNLKEQIYQFYNDYKFVDNRDEEIRYVESAASRNLFQQGSTDIQISAIVGKNGSGKSTISELIYLGINAIARTNSMISDELIGEDVYLDFYFFTTDLFKLSIVGRQIQVYKYDYSVQDKEELFKLVEDDSISEFNFDSFFYTIGINYSLYGLNVKNLNDWIDPLFHKNDSYQVPIVLNPKRTEGKIDVNTEEALSKFRLLVHVLDFDRFDESEEGDSLVPELVEDKRPEKLKISFNTEKYNVLAKTYAKYKIRNRFVDGEGLIHELTIDEVFKVFWTRLGNPTIEAVNHRKPVEHYIVYKLFGIGETYKRYRELFQINHKKKTIEFIGAAYLFMDEVLKDTSHVTFKLWQAIHYLIYAHIPIGKKDSDASFIESLATNISDLKGIAAQDKLNIERYPDRKYDVILFVPPSIFDVNIVFDNGSLFNGLSSGEKQSIFAINTVSYHLYNLNSVDSLINLQTYSNVNVLFDEVELCFHPDMQRKFINDLLYFLGHLELQFIPSVHFQFITHSPFILSDIPSSNILRLKDGEPQKQSNQTFAANIYDLLNDDFFLTDGVIGEFAKQKINTILKKKQILQEDVDVIELIGDPLLKSVLLEKVNAKIDDDELIKRQIQKLEEQLKKNSDATD